MDNIHQAAVLADDYALTHKPVYRQQSGDLQPCTIVKGSSSNISTGGGTSQASGRASSDLPVRRSQRFPSGPTCYYCKKKEHVMSECRALERKNQRVDPDLLITSQIVDTTGSVNEIQDQGKSVTLGSTAGSGLSPFVSKGFVCLEGSKERVPIKVLRDTGATQSLILDSVLPFSDQSSTGVSVLLQGVEMGVISVPLHVINLQSDIISGTVVIGQRTSLPVKDISMILGNDLAGDKVMGDPRVSDIPCLDTEREQVKNLFPSCAVTRAMARAAEKAEEKNRQDKPSHILVDGEGETTVGSAVTPTLCGVLEVSRESESMHQSGREMKSLGLSPS